MKKAFNSPNYLGVNYLDKLPVEMQASNTVHEFKHKIARHLKDGLFGT